MKEQLITFETANLAKEKKFDWNCHWVLYRGTSSVLHKCDAIPTKGKNLESGDYVLQPTQSLLQRWLREVHNIQLCLQPIYGGNKVDGKQVGWLCYTPFQDEDFNKLPSISLSQYTLEAALEKGLQEALKLIQPNEHS